MHDNGPKVSVIIPVYNSARFLHAAVGSVFAQSYQNIEIVLIDDGSTDASHEICDQLAAKSASIVALHQENRGVSAARNVGIEHATGDYLCFLDADDELVPEAIELLTATAETTQADIVQSGYNIFNMEGDRLVGTQCKQYQVGEYRDITDDPQKFFLLLNTGLLDYVCDKFYRHSVLSQAQIKFNPIFVTGEDHVFNLMLVRHIHKFVVTDHILYRYYLRTDQSTTRKFIPDLFLQYINKFTLIYEIAEKLGVAHAIKDQYLYPKMLSCILTAYAQLKGEKCTLSCLEQLVYLRKNYDPIHATTWIDCKTLESLIPSCMPADATRSSSLILKLILRKQYFVSLLLHYLLKGVHRYG